MDFAQYWFMFPVAILVATTAMLSGIGGAALFMPIFLLAFPLLGPEYPLASPVAAIAVALLTNAFGFSSGFISYYRRRLIDFAQAKPFLYVAVPAAVCGAILSHFFSPLLIKSAYGILTLGLAVLLIRRHTIAARHHAEEGAARVIVDNQGKVYRYHPFSPRRVLTAFGAFLSGMLSAGIGEVVMPQLLRDARIPIPVAAATSVLVVIVTVMSASIAHLVALISVGGINAVPWNLVCYTIPGVIIGGQIGPRLQGKVATETMQKAIGILFGFIGLAMLASVAGAIY